ncbi:MAG: hypothetical protein ACI8XB_002954 [Patiriisocius sp.]|jgi:hypothetical protein
MKKNGFLLGGIFGFLVPVIAIYMEFQLPSSIANILLFPVVMLTNILDVSIGMFSFWQHAIGLFISIAFWGTIFAVASIIIAKIIGKD